VEKGPVEHQSAAPEGFRLHRRWDRMGRLVGDAGMARLLDSHVLVIGLGGVGSFAAEALARSGVGRLTLVDFDLVCVTNTNRQLQALRGTVGQPKASVLAERLRLVHPDAKIRPVPLFYDARLSDVLLGGGELGRPDHVLDAIDNVTAKCHLLASCRARGLPVLCATGAAGRWDPTAIRVADLSETTIDPLAATVRRVLREKHDFPRKGSFGIPAVYSTERPRPPEALGYDGDEGFSCVCPNGDNDVHTCDDRNVIWGTASFVTGAFGLAAASVVVRQLVGAG
jgi:tRNA A37 threonylcarbamoyladenosine dehydratase